jgi:hypothetical protein
MPDFGEQAKIKRELAARARRWAKDLSYTDDRKPLEHHAAELEKEAAELERRAAVMAPSRPVVQMQQQTQQQRGSSPDATASKDDKPKT